MGHELNEQWRDVLLSERRGADDEEIERRGERVQIAVLPVEGPGVARDRLGSGIGKQDRPTSLWGGPRGQLRRTRTVASDQQLPKARECCRSIIEYGDSPWVNVAVDETSSV